MWAVAHSRVNSAGDALALLLIAGGRTRASVARHSTRDCRAESTHRTAERKIKDTFVFGAPVSASPGLGTMLGRRAGVVGGLRYGGKDCTYRIIAKCD
jgi:hypothetical protein